MSDDPVPSIRDFMQMRAWKHALFTTYALSLSYFESEVLQPLLRMGCSDVWLIADAEGYRSSLLERRSMRVGQEYRLIPAALPDGVFHAKCIYLAADEGDLLLVGSGNLTFAGHGKNAEVFEALSPDSAASAFHDFADFLISIGSRSDIRIARSDWVDDFAARARLAADRGRDQNGVPPLRLVHPLNQRVIDQLPDLLGPYGPCTNAIIMSPYHDPDGHAVRTVSERLDVPHTWVAVTNAGTSPFPFNDAGAWPHPALPVRPVRKDKRFVHAKWYEFRTEAHRLLLTGSINATRKALTTTDNVELGVLRCLPPSSEPFPWEPVGRPVFEPHHRMPSGLRENEIVYASFDRYDAGMLTGRIISLRSTEGIWTGRLIQAEGDATSFDVSVDADSTFAVKSSALEAFSEMSALQLVMSIGEREARGWVHNDMFLSLSGRRRLTAGSLSRLMRREGTDDDIEALLDYLSTHAELHLRIFERPVGKASENTKGEEEAGKPVIIDLTEIAPVAETPDSPPLPRGHASGPDQFEMAVTRLRRTLLGHGRTRSTGSQHPSESALAEEDDPEGGRKDNLTLEERSRRIGLTDFEHEIAQLISDASGKPEVVRGLLTMAFEVGLWMRIYRLNDLDAAHEFLHSWFLKTCGLAKPHPERLTSLQQHIVTAAAILFRLTASTSGSSKVGAELHDSLERYYGGPVGKEQAVQALIPDVHAGFAELLSGISDHAELVESLSAVLSQPTARQQLANALALAAQRKPIPADWEVFASPVGAELHKALCGPDWQKKVRPGGKGMSACAFDYFSFSSHEAACYSRLRIGRCIHCEQFTVNVHP